MNSTLNRKPPVSAGDYNNKHTISDVQVSVTPDNHSSILSSPTENDSLLRGSHITQPTYSVLQVRVVLSLIVILYSTCAATPPLISQYLLDRWSDHNQTHTGDNICNRNSSDQDIQTDDALQSRVSLTTMYISYALAGPAVLSSLIFGGVADLIGRRPLFISTLVGSNVRIVLLVFIIWYKMDIWWMYVGALIDGFCGTFAVTLQATFTITADISHERSGRIFWIAFMTVVGSATMAMSNLGVGYLIKYTTYSTTIIALLSPLVITLFLAIFFLPETLPESQRHQKRSLSYLGKSMSQMVFLYTRDGSRESRLALFFSLLIFFVSVMNLINISSTDTLYQRHEPLCWNSVQIGEYGAFRSAGQYILALLFLKAHQSINCVRDEAVAMIGLCFVAGSLVLEAFVQNTWQMYLVPIISIPGANVSSITRGVMSMLVGKEKQGVLFSSIAVIESICAMIAATIFNKVYAATVSFMPGAVYLVMAGVSMCAFLLYIPYFYFHNRRPEANNELLIQSDNEDDPLLPKDEICK